MKVFFAVSPRAIKQHGMLFRKIYDFLEKRGYKNLNAIPAIDDPDEFYDCTQDQIQEMYVDLTTKLKRADIVVVETTIHSLSMGFYVKMALDLDKPTIVLHQPGSAPFFFMGIQNARLQILEYKEENISEVLRYGLDYAKENVETRFNLFLTPELYNYLKWAAQKSNTQRANLVRSLLLKHKQENETEYQQDSKK